VFDRLGRRLAGGRGARQRPATGILDAAELVPPQSPMAAAVALRGRQQQGSQAGEAVRADPPGGDQFAQGIFQFGAQQVGVRQQFVEEQRAVRLQHVGNRLRT
jgi:hypothetical protein